MTRQIGYSVILLLLGLSVFTAQAQDSDEYQRTLEDIEEARQTHAERFILNIPTIPPELFTLTDLKFLMINGNGITSLPPEIGNLTRLETLALSRNSLTTLPEEMSQLRNLKLLLLSGNGFKELPSFVWSMTSLEELWLDYNQLTMLPPEIGQLTNLTILNLGGNKITTLPPEIGLLKNLCWLDANSNQLKDLPLEVTQVESLARGEGCTTQFGGSIREGLQIWGNPLPYPDDVIIGDTRTIFTYLDNQAGYYTQRMLLSFGVITVVTLAIGYKKRRQGEKKKKRSE